MHAGKHYGMSLSIFTYLKKKAFKEVRLGYYVWLDLVCCVYVRSCMVYVICGMLGLVCCISCVVC